MMPKAQTSQLRCIKALKLVLVPKKVNSWVINVDFEENKTYYLFFYMLALY